MSIFDIKGGSTTPDGKLVDIANEILRLGFVGLFWKKMFQKDGTYSRLMGDNSGSTENPYALAGVARGVLLNEKGEIHSDLLTEDGKFSTVELHINSSNSTDWMYGPGRTILEEMDSTQEQAQAILNHLPLAEVFPMLTKANLTAKADGFTELWHKELSESVNSKLPKMDKLVAFVEKQRPYPVRVFPSGNSLKDCRLAIDKERLRDSEAEASIFKE